MRVGKYFGGSFPKLFGMQGGKNNFGANNLTGKKIVGDVQNFLGVAWQKVLGWDGKNLGVGCDIFGVVGWQFLERWCANIF